MASAGEISDLDIPQIKRGSLQEPELSDQWTDCLSEWSSVPAGVHQGTKFVIVISTDDQRF